jgi:CPA2 family monovalent cation:H+ antiporter-2
MPLLIASHRKMEALAMILADMAVPRGTPRGDLMRPLLVRMLHGAGLIALGAVVLAASATLLTGWISAVALLALVALLGWLFGRSFNAWYTKAKFALVEVWQNPPAPEATRGFPASLQGAALETIRVPPAMAGRSLRELALRSLTGASIVAIEREGASIPNPDAGAILEAGDEILLIGSADQLHRAADLFGVPSGAG